MLELEQQASIPRDAHRVEVRDCSPAGARQKDVELVPCSTNVPARCSATRRRLRQVLTNLPATRSSSPSTARSSCASRPGALTEASRCGVRGHRHGHRHRGRAAAPHLRAVRAGRRLDHAALRRHGAGPGHQAPARRAHGRPARRASRARSRLHVPLRGSAVAGVAPPRAGAPAWPPATRACSGRGLAALRDSWLRRSRAPGCWSSARPRRRARASWPATARIAPRAVVVRLADVPGRTCVSLAATTPRHQALLPRPQAAGCPRRRFAAARAGAAWPSPCGAWRLLRSLAEALAASGQPAPAPAARRPAPRAITAGREDNPVNQRVVAACCAGAGSA